MECSRAPAEPVALAREGLDEDRRSDFEVLRLIAESTIESKGGE